MFEDFEHLDLDALRRRRTVKWARYAPDVLPAWVAEMDFPVAEPIRRALVELAASGDFGYPEEHGDNRVEAVFAARADRLWGWRPDPGRTVVVTDIVRALINVVTVFSEPGDAVVVPTPVYPPFLASVRDNGRRLVEVPAIPAGDRWTLDVEALDAAVAESRAPLLLLCHPHNPIGRVYERDDLAAVAHLAAERDLVVVSDEIHAELTRPGPAFRPLASISPEIEARTVTLNSATKAFNIPGVRCGVVSFGSGGLFDRYCRVFDPERGGVSLFGYAATRAAWTECDDWLAAVVDVLGRNRDWLVSTVPVALPGVELRAPEATFLAWLDCRGIDTGGLDPATFFLAQAKVALSDGRQFGAAGDGFVRLNFGTSPALLAEIVERMSGHCRPRESGRLP